VPVDVGPVAGSPADPRVGDAGQQRRDDLVPEGERGADDGQRVVGALLAFYSERLVAGRVEQFCNMGAWCVLPAYRSHSIRLLIAMLAQEGYHFTCLSPSDSVRAITSQLKFRWLDTSAALIPNLPWPTLAGRTRISSEPNVIERTLAGTALELYRDHARALSASLEPWQIDYLYSENVCVPWWGPG